MKVVNIKVEVRNWYSHADKGESRILYYGGSYEVNYNGHIKSKSIDPYSKKFIDRSFFVIKMLTEAIELLKEPCEIIIDIPSGFFEYGALKDKIYSYWKRNNWCYKNGVPAADYWKVFDRIINEGRHSIIVKEVELKGFNPSFEDEINDDECEDVVHFDLMQ